MRELEFGDLEFEREVTERILTSMGRLCQGNTSTSRREVTMINGAGGLHPVMDYNELQDEEEEEGKEEREVSYVVCTIDLMQS